jgi:hypothetical protein
MAPSTRSYIRGPPDQFRKRHVQSQDDTDIGDLAQTKSLPIRISNVF